MIQRGINWITKNTIHKYTKLYWEDSLITFRPSTKDNLPAYKKYLCILILLKILRKLATMPFKESERDLKTRIRGTNKGKLSIDCAVKFI